MRLLNSDVRQYQGLCKKYFGEEVKDEDAREQLTRLVRQMEIVYQPVTHAQFNSYLKKHVKESEGDERPNSH